MTNPQPTPPLWKAMDEAMDSALRHGLSSHSWRLVRAAELRAIADAVVPEEPLPPDDADGYCMVERYQRQKVRQRLLAEVDRAERGEAE